jgi:hypothetical protein
MGNKSGKYVAAAKAVKSLFRRFVENEMCVIVNGGVEISVERWWWIILRFPWWAMRYRGGYADHSIREAAAP